MDRLKKKVFRKSRDSAGEHDHDTTGGPNPSLTGFLDNVNRSSLDQDTRRRSRSRTLPSEASTVPNATSVPSHGRKEGHRTGLVGHDIPPSGINNAANVRKSHDHGRSFGDHARSSRVDSAPPRTSLDLSTNDLSLDRDLDSIMARQNQQRYSEDIADRNISAFSPSEAAYGSSRNAVNNQHSGHTEPRPRKFSISRKPVGSSPSSPSSPPSQNPENRQQIAQSLEGLGHQSSPRRQTQLSSSQMGTSNAQHGEAQAVAEELSRVVDLSNTEDVTLHHHYSPAVTCELVKPKVHHIQEQKITREVHNHDVFHRILPIIDIQVLPPRHFVPTRTASGNEILQEVLASALPGRTGENNNWVVAETVSKMKHKLTPSTGGIDPDLKVLDKRRFTARRFDEDDPEPYMTPEGYVRTETTWVHPPALEQGAQLSGQTVPMHFGTPPASDVEKRMQSADLVVNDEHPSGRELRGSGKGPQSIREPALANTSVNQGQPHPKKSALSNGMPLDKPYREFVSEDPRRPGYEDNYIPGGWIDGAHDTRAVHHPNSNTSTNPSARNGHVHGRSQAFI